MSDRLRALREQRAKLIKDARALTDKAEAEKRELTGEEDAQFSKMFDDADKLKAKIDREEQLIEEERKLALGRFEETHRDPANPAPVKRARDTEEYRTAFRRYILEGRQFLNPEEIRALSAENPITGGYVVTPQQFLNELIKAIDDQVFIRRLARKIPVTAAASLGVPSLDADPADADWTSELATGSEDSTMAFGKRELHPYPLAKRIKISNKLLRVAALDPESLVRERLAYKFAVTEEKAFLLGTGAGQPLGVFTASNDGIPTSRDMSTDNTSTAITTDGLKNAKYNQKGGYWARMQWLFHRDGVKMIAKLKDTTNQYIWTDSIVEGEPDRLLGAPVNMSEFVPNTFTTGLYVGILGDFASYWIADAMQIELQRLVELYAETNQTGLIGRLECDGAPVLAEAFTRVKLA